MSGVRACTPCLNIGKAIIPHGRGELGGKCPVGLACIIRKQILHSVYTSYFLRVGRSISVYFVFLYVQQASLRRVQRPGLGARGGEAEGSLYHQESTRARRQIPTVHSRCRRQDSVSLHGNREGVMTPYRPMNSAI